MVKETDQLRERARKCRSLAWGYDDKVGESLIELAEELEARAAQLDQEEGREPQLAPKLRPA